MKHRVFSFCLALSCAAAPPQQVADETATELSAPERAYAHVVEALAALPTCAPGVEGQPVEVVPTFCTRMACTTECCNRCGWQARLGGEPVNLAPVLQLPDGALDCEIQAWRRAATGHSLFVGEARACVAR